MERTLNNNKLNNMLNKYKLNKVNNELDRMAYDFYKILQNLLRGLPWWLRPESPAAPALQVDSLLLSHQKSPPNKHIKL